MIAVRIYGDAGTPMIAVHGSGMNAASWRPLADALPGFVIAAIDLRGNGRSETSDDLSTHALLEDIRGVANALEWPQPVVAGHSVGANLAVAFAARRRSCRAMVALEPTTVLDRREVALAKPEPGYEAMRQRLVSSSSFGRTLSEAERREALARFAAERRRSWPERVEAEMLDRSLLALGDGSFRKRPEPDDLVRFEAERRRDPIAIEDLRAVAVPALLVFGTQHRFAGRSDEVAALVGEPRMVAWTSGAHTPHLDSVEETAAAILSLIRLHAIG